VASLLPAISLQGSYTKLFFWALTRTPMEVTVDSINNRQRSCEGIACLQAQSPCLLQLILDAFFSSKLHIFFYTCAHLSPYVGGTVSGKVILSHSFVLFGDLFCHGSLWWIKLATRQLLVFPYFFSVTCAGPGLSWPSRQL